MIRAVADTHALHWFLFADPRLSQSAKQFIEQCHQQGDLVGVSSISFVELVYLVEKNRIPSTVFTLAVNEVNAAETVFVEIPLTFDVARTMSRLSVQDVPDMPDRIIAATALHLNVPVISRHSKIKLSTTQTIW